MNLQSLEQLIKENHKYIKDPRVVLEVERFLLEHPIPSSVPGLAASTALSITKMVNFARKETLVKAAGATYDAPTWIAAVGYCKFGIGRLEGNQPEPAIQTHEARTLVHYLLNDNAGNFSLKLARMTSETFRRERHLTEAHRFYTRALESGADVLNDEIVGYTFGYRGHAAKEIGHMKFSTERINWLESAARDTLEGAERTKNFDKRHAAYQYSIASKYLYWTATLANRTPRRQIQLLKEAIEHQETALFLHDVDPKFQAESDYTIAKCYDLLFKITNDVENAKNALKFYEFAAAWLPDHKEIKQTAAKRAEELRKICA